MGSDRPRRGFFRRRGFTRPTDPSHGPGPAARHDPDQHAGVARIVFGNAGLDLADQIAADVGTLPGAAGGPKALGIQGLDLALFGEWLPAAPRDGTNGGCEGADNSAAGPGVVAFAGAGSPTASVRSPSFSSGSPGPT